jgi:hypothetical protein
LEDKSGKTPKEVEEIVQARSFHVVRLKYNMSVVHPSQQEREKRGKTLRRNSGGTKESRLCSHPYSGIIFKMLTKYP